MTWLRLPILLVSCFALFACTSRTATIDGRKVAHVDTETFRLRAAQLTLSREDAATALHESGNGPYADVKTLLRHQRFLIDDDYHFVEDVTKLDVSLDGFYVNGQTGTVEYRVGQPWISSRRMARLGWPITTQYVPEDQR